MEPLAQWQLETTCLRTNASNMRVRGNMWLCHSSQKARLVGLNRKSQKIGATRNPLNQPFVAMKMQPQNSVFTMMKDGVSKQCNEAGKNQKYKKPAPRPLRGVPYKEISLKDLPLLEGMGTAGSPMARCRLKSIVLVLGDGQAGGYNAITIFLQIIYSVDVSLSKDCRDTWQIWKPQKQMLPWLKPVRTNNK